MLDGKEVGYDSSNSIKFRMLRLSKARILPAEFCGRKESGSSVITHTDAKIISVDLTIQTVSPPT